MIQFSDVAVCYEPHARYPVNAVEGVNLFIKPGEWVFFVGPSGAGKSTLLKLVYGGSHAMRGRIVVDGQDVTELPAREIPFLRRKVGVIFQDFQLLTQKTVWENVAFALQVIGAPQKRLVRDIPRALETVGLTHKAGARPHELSGGEAQRVAIARAIVNDPKILIADEPTGNLDPRTAWDIAQVLKKINERGTTILMATHDRTLVDTLRKRVVRIADGRIVSDEEQGVYHPEDDELPHLEEAPAVTALDGDLANLVGSTSAQVPLNFSTEKEPAPAPPRPSQPPLAATAPASPAANGTANGATTNGSTANGAATNGTVSNGAIAPHAASAPHEPQRETVETDGVRQEEEAQDAETKPVAAPRRADMCLEQIAKDDDSDGISWEKALDHKAPIGSPENPIVQLGRASEVPVPRDLEL